MTYSSRYSFVDCNFRILVFPGFCLHRKSLNSATSKNTLHSSWGGVNKKKVSREVFVTFLKLYLNAFGNC